MSYKSKITALLALAVCFQACRTMKQNLDGGISATVDRMVIVPTAVARFSVAVSKQIYLNDSLKDGTSYADTMRAVFDCSYRIPGNAMEEKGLSKITAFASLTAAR